jgi:hypothetical protein
MLLQRIKPCRYLSDILLTLLFCLFSNNLYACLSRNITFSICSPAAFARESESFSHISIECFTALLLTWFIEHFVFIDRLMNGLLSHLCVARCL